jgi:hypothetical protein
MNEHSANDASTAGHLVPARRLRISIFEVMVLVAALAVCFRWSGLSLPVGLLLLYTFVRRRDILRRSTRLALGQIALALYVPPAVGFFLVSPQEWERYMTYFSLMPTFIPGTLIARVLPWFDWFHAPLFPSEVVILSTLTVVATIGGLGMVARRGRISLITCATFVVVMSAASTWFVWVLLHAGA